MRAAFARERGGEQDGCSDIGAEERTSAKRKGFVCIGEERTYRKRAGDNNTRLKPREGKSGKGAKLLGMRLRQVVGTFIAHRKKLLAGRRMNPDRRVEIGFGGA